MITLAVVKFSPVSNPDRVFLKATVSGNYVPGAGDPLNLTPSSWSDPKAIGSEGPDGVPAVTPAAFNENLGGYYTEVVRGSTLANFAVRFFQPGGAEVGAGAYPAAITGGELVFEVPF